LENGGKIEPYTITIMEVLIYSVDTVGLFIYVEAKKGKNPFCKEVKLRCLAGE
jgi:hypothetical protein